MVDKKLADAAAKIAAATKVKPATQKEWQKVIDTAQAVLKSAGIRS